MENLRANILLASFCLVFAVATVPIFAQTGNQIVPREGTVRDPFANQGSNTSLSGSGGQGAFGQGLDDVFGLAKQNKLAGKSSAKDILLNIMKWLLALVGMIATISLLYGGYLYITSQGEVDQATQAKHIILYSVLGILLIGISAIVVNVVISVATG